MIFRKLNEEEILKFKKWARNNYTSCTEISGVWHPVVQAECTKINEEEILKFKKWARDNYTPYTEISGVWHPVVQAECVKINEETDADHKEVA